MWRPRESNILTKPPSIRTLPRIIPPAPERDAEEEQLPQQPSEDDKAGRVQQREAPATSSGAKTLEEQRSRKGLRPGQLDPDVGSEIAHRMAELQGRRSYLRNFWYAAGARHGPLLLPPSSSPQATISLA
jgi:hypothetical protein